MLDIQVNPHVTPVSQPYRKIPIHLEDVVEKKLDDLLAQGIIEVVDEPCRWVSAMVIVPKADGDVRICIDMRQANKAIVRETHPLPTLDDIWPQLKGAKVFSKLDIRNAFHQIELAPESRFITTFITKRGLMRYTRLIFGINNAPELFQKTLSRILAGCPGVINYMDDILIFGRSKKEHDRNYEIVKKRLDDYSVLLNEDKTEFSKSSVKFVGHTITPSGVQPNSDKLEAVKKFRSPESPEELRSFLGLITYLGRFIPNLATLADPLRTLIKNSSNSFTWAENDEKCFQTLKSSIVESITLGFFDKSDETEVVTDASPVGLGAILIQRNKDNMERVIMFASKSLSGPERRYSQTEKEALAIVWSIERFHFYLIGCSFTLVTDHKPLMCIFNPSSKPCARIERWVLRLMPYEFVVKYRRGKDNIADPLSRLSAVDETPEIFDEESDHYVNAIVESAKVAAVTLDEIKSTGQDDDELKELKLGLEKDIWSESVKKWRTLAAEFCFFDNLLLRNNRIYVPLALRERVLASAHEGHPGRNKLIQRLRERVWWPKMSRDGEEKSKSCVQCTLVSAPNPPIPLKMRELPTSPWKELAIDFTSASSYNKELLVIIDYYSRFVDIKIQSGTTAEETIRSLQQIFPLLGYPDSITCDNGPPFNSKEFNSFCYHHAIRIHHTPPLFAQANGLVERQNRGIKKRLQISYLSNSRNWQDDLLVDYLTMYRSTPQETTGKSPYELLFGRQMKDKIPILRRTSSINDDEIRERDKQAKEKMKKNADKKRRAKESTIAEGDKVFLQNKPGDKLTSNFSPEIYTVTRLKAGDCLVKSDKSGVIRRRHVSALKKIPIGNTLVQEEAKRQQEESERPPSPFLIFTAPPDGERSPSIKHQREGEGTITDGRSSKRSKRTPARYKDYVRKTIFEEKEGM